MLIPTLDTGKHYAIGDDEVEKLVRKGEGWLANHPEKETIVRRYLKGRRSLVQDALEQLTQDRDAGDGRDLRSVTTAKKRSWNANSACMSSVWGRCWPR